jgi:ADP-ribose pyrophosphatase
LIDDKEDAETAAARELLEETGYSGKVIAVSPPLALEPGLTNGL